MFRYIIIIIYEVTTPNLDPTADREEVSRPSMKLEIPTKKNVPALMHRSLRVVT